MNLDPKDANLISVFIRKLNPGKTYEDFRNAWYPDKGFGIPARVINSVNKNDESEILSIGFLKLPDEDFNETIQRIAEQESVRHDRISEVIDKTSVKGIFIIKNDDDLS